MMDAALEAFFARYLDAWNALDPVRIAAHYTVPAAIADRGGLQVFDSVEALGAKFHADCTMLRAAGFVAADFEAGTSRALGAAAVAVDLGCRMRWGAGERAFRSIYLCQRRDEGWAIFAAQAYEEADGARTP